MDSDDDGIWDIVESGNGASDANEDGTFSSNDPGFVDTDGDGIVDPFDQDPNVFGDAGDLGTSDDISDSTNPFSGGTGPLPDSGTDADGDGIADSVDNDDTVFGSPPVCAVGSIHYAITDGTMNTTGYVWDDASTPAGDVPSTQEYGINRSTSYCQEGTWRHYHNANEPDKLLFSIEMGANTTEIDYIDLRVDQNPASRYDTIASSAMFVMSRDWFVKTVNDDPLTAAVNIRFYYPESELKSVLDDAIALANTDPTATAPTPGDIVWFKKDSFDPSSDITPTGDALVQGNGYTVLTPVVAANANGEASTDASTIGNNTNYVQFDGVTGFSGGSAFILLNGTALPVELSKFESNVEDCDVRLIWQSESEDNFDYYQIEWSADGDNFSKLERVTGKGEGITSTYQYLHLATEVNNYYRLKMVDLDGSFEYSKILNAKTDCRTDTEIILYPNPTSKSTGVLNIKFYSVLTETQVQIVDMLGRTVKSISTGTDIGWNTMTLDISDLPSATYNVRLEGGTNNSKMLIIQE